MEDIVQVVQISRLLWYGLVLRKVDDDWVKVYITVDFEGVRQRSRPRKT